jgi:hypothetical protein
MRPSPTVRGEVPPQDGAAAAHSAVELLQLVRRRRQPLARRRQLRLRRVQRLFLGRRRLGRRGGRAGAPAGLRRRRGVLRPEGRSDPPLLRWLLQRRNAAPTSRTA